MAMAASRNPNLTRDSVAIAIDALLKWMRARAKQQKAQLLEHDDLLYLVLTLKKIPPKGRTNPYRIPLPHSLHPLDPSSTSICLLADDRPSSPLPPSAARDLLQTLTLPISDVIGLSDLRSDYRPFEARRKLCDSYDLFFADRKILPLLPRLLGKHFFKRKKIPLAVDLSRKGWPEQIRHCCGSTLFYLRTGTCSGLKVGRVSMDRDEIVENVMAAIEGVMEFVPKKWGNVRSLHVKSVDSLALPIYQAVPEMGLKIEGFWKREEESGKGEIFMGEEEEVKKLGSSKKTAVKKGRIHEVGYMDSDLEVGDADVSEELGVEKRVRKKLKKDGDAKHEDDAGEEKVSDELGGEKKGLKPKRKKGDGLVNEDDDGMHLGDQEEEKVSDELAVRKRMTKKVVKGKVLNGKRGGNNDVGGEQNGSDELTVKKRVKKSISKNLEDKDVKKTKKSKLKHVTG